MSDTERDQLARSFITSHVNTYPLLDPTKLTVSTGSIAGTPPAFSVTISYDMSANFVYGLAGEVPLPGKTILRSAVIQYGGY